MAVARFVVDLVDGVNHIDNILHRYGLVGAQHHRSLRVVADAVIDESGELGLVGRGLSNEVLELVVDVDGDGLSGHGLATA